MSVAGKKYFVIGSLEKGVRVIELLADHDSLSVSEAASHLDINRSAAHRFLATLRELGWAEKNNEGKYRLTFRILEQGMKVADRFEIRRMARPFMQRLAGLTNETVNLGYWDGQGIVHLDKIDSQNILRMDSRIGSHAPAYCTALGKAILAFLPKEDLDIYMRATEFETTGPNTITEPATLEAELAKIRKKGVAVDDEEMAPGLRCVAAPVFDYTDHPRYSLSVSGPAMRMKKSLIAKIEGDLKTACAELSALLGKPGGGRS
jgi:DNA-binding IclR family transcriptional regulator